MDILKRLMDHQRESWRPEEKDPFKALIRTILSQNTNFRNEMSAFRKLDMMLGVTPASLAKAELDDIASSIEVAGLFRIKAQRIKQVAETIQEKYGGDLWRILSKPLEEARRELMTLPGVGEKTADVILLFTAGKPVIPVDRHIFRVTKRLGIVQKNATYDDVRETLERAVPQKDYEDVHILLIQFGRDYCRARNPRCGACFLWDLCLWEEKERFQFL
jgi:endonuclease-3